MSAQLDEGVPVRLVKALAGIGCRVLRFPNEWKGLTNGQLLDRMVRSGSTCLITCDRNIHHQHNVRLAGISLVVLPRQRFEDLLPFIPTIASAVDEAVPGEIVIIQINGDVTRY